MKTVDHPNILKIYEYYIDSANIYIATELCLRGDLSKYVKKLGFIAEEEACYLVF